MFCSKCGNQMGNARFCSNCGADNGVGQAQEQETVVNNPGVWSYYVKVLKNYAKFSGRARRSEYWYFMLFNVIVGTVIGFIGLFFGIRGGLQELYQLAVFIPFLAVAIRRMHDVNKSGWYILIPVYGFILCFIDGTKGVNRYGEDPKQIN